MANINIRVDDTLKAQSFAVIKDFGLTPSQAVQLFLTQIAKTGKIPLSFDYIDYEKNPTTMQAINDFRAGKMYSIEELINNELDNDDD